MYPSHYQNAELNMTKEPYPGTIQSLISGSVNMHLLMLHMEKSHNSFIWPQPRGKPMGNLSFPYGLDNRTTDLLVNREY